MKLKSLFIIACSCFCVSAVADETEFRQFVANGKITPKICPVNTSHGMLSVKFGSLASRAEAPTAVKPVRAPQYVRERSVDESTLKLDSIIQINVDGTKLQKQQYVYNGQGKEINRKTSYWNASTQTWDDPYEEYDYEWTEYGYILS